MIAILAVNVTFLPIAIAFFKEDIEPGWVAFNCISDFLFIIDIVLNFFTGVITSENTVVLDLKEIRRQYMKKWFILDVISVFPFDYIVLGITQTAKESLDLFTAARVLRLLRLIKLLSLVRLLKLARFLRYLTKWEEVSLKRSNFHKLVYTYVRIYTAASLPIYNIFFIHIQYLFELSKMNHNIYLLIKIVHWLCFSNLL